MSMSCVHHFYYRWVFPVEYSRDVFFHLWLWRLKWQSQCGHLEVIEGFREHMIHYNVKQVSVIFTVKRWLSDPLAVTPRLLGPSGHPCGQREGAARVGGLWTLRFLNKHLLGSNYFRAPVLGSSDWAADTLRKGPDLSICSLVGRHLNKWSIQTMWGPMETRQGRPGWGVRARVTAQSCDQGYWSCTGIWFPWTSWLDLLSLWNESFCSPKWSLT